MAMVKKLTNIHLNELNEAYQKVLYFFFSFPGKEISLSDLASNLKIAKTTANKIVVNLVKEGFLDKKVYGKTWRITCNQNHVYNISKKIPFNLAMVYAMYNHSKEEIFKTAGNVRSVVLFGSYRKGDDTEESDLDLAVEVAEGKLKIKELGVISNFGFRKNVVVNLHFFSRKQIDLNLFSNIANGIVIDGFLEVK